MGYHKSAGRVSGRPDHSKQSHRLVRAELRVITCQQEELVAGLITQGSHIDRLERS
jgi:hypothetical protein